MYLTYLKSAVFWTLHPNEDGNYDEKERVFDASRITFSLDWGDSAMPAAGGAIAFPFGTQGW